MEIGDLVARDLKGDTERGPNGRQDGDFPGVYVADEEGSEPVVPRGMGRWHYSPSTGQMSRVRELLEQGNISLILPTEVFVHFYPASPEQVINAAYAAGFNELYFETLGDELVAMEYLRQWRENTDKKTWIRSTSPLLVEYCRWRHPELLAYLAPIVTPPVALARYLKRQLGDDRRIVYAGLDFPATNGHEEFASHISFPELQHLFEERRASPGEQPILLRVMPPDLRRYLAAPGGLPLPMLDQERASSRTFRKLRGLHTLEGLAELVQTPEGQQLGFIDVLPFDGLLDHPALGDPNRLYWRRSLLQLAEPARSERPIISVPDDIDLSTSFPPRESTLPEDEIQEVVRALEEVGTTHDGGVWKTDPLGYARYLSLTESIMRSRPELAVGLFHMSRNYSRAVRDATHDALTDLYSYRALVERVREEMGQANRAGSSIAMLFVDLDDFKEINDRYGHPTGNEILKGVASVLQQSMRSTDIAGRFGGDEFVVLLVDSDENGAVRVAEQIREGVAGTFVEIPGGKVGTTVSIGVAFHDAATRALTSSDELFAEADASLYIAKAQGGNRVHPAVREGTPQ
jgi:diguanylate cyclase (GGDEF)-like protein